MILASLGLRFSTARAAFALGATAGLPSSANRGGILLLVACLAATSVAAGQSPYPTTAAPQAAWGGYVVPQPVPYQPTLSDGAPVSTPLAEASSPVSGPVAAATGPAAPVIIVPEECVPPGAAVFPAYPCLDAAGCPPPEAVYCQTIPQAQAESLLPPGTRDGVFQKIKFTGTWLPQIEADSLGMTDLQLDVVFGLPFFTRETPLVITPFYAVHFLDGPEGLDVPPRLHDAAIDFHHFRRIGGPWIADASVTVGEYADDDSFNSSEALRITGQGVVVYEASPAWKWILGAAYVDRANATVLPVAGVSFHPNDDVHYDLVFPAPKISWRLPYTAIPGRDERWLYVAAEFGGGVWAVERAGGASDTLSLSDYRVILGLERKIVGGLSRRIEVGYVFGQKLEYAGPPGEISLDDTLMLRGGLTY